MHPEVEGAIKSIYRRFASECPDLFEHSIVAGGAIRDSLLNKPVKDIDIFVPWHRDNVDKHVAAYANMGVWLTRNTDRVTADDEKYPDQHIYVYNVPTLGFVPVQIICDTRAKTRSSILANFNVGISQVYFDPIKNKIVKSRMFTKSLEDKIFYYRSKNVYDAKYCMRIWDKYEDVLMTAHSLP